MDLIEKALVFFQENLLASYGAAVGTIALALNFMRYKHTLSNSKVKLRLEISNKMSEDEFNKYIERQGNDGYGGARTTAITHTIKIRNIGNITAHIEKAWIIHNKSTTVNAVIKSSVKGIYMPVSDLGGNLEIKPRSSVSLSILSDKKDGYIKPKIAYAVDETGKKWQGRQ